VDGIYGHDGRDDGGSWGMVSLVDKALPDPIGKSMDCRVTEARHSVGGRSRLNSVETRRSDQ